MRAGSRNVPVDIYYYTETPDPRYNNPVQTVVLWKSNIFTKQLPRRGKEIEVAGQIAAESYVKFDFDFYDVDGISELMVIDLGGALFDIKAILRDDNMKQYIVVDATSRNVPLERV